MSKKRASQHELLAGGKRTSSTPQRGQDVASELTSQLHSEHLTSATVSLSKETEIKLFPALGEFPDWHPDRALAAQVIL